MKGSHQLTCSAGELITVDCAAQGSFDVGETCVVDASGGAQCGFGVCAAATPASCDGNVEVDCGLNTYAGVVGRVTCPAGASCVDGIGCAGDGAPCTNDRCDGDDYVSCLNGHEWRQHCAAEPVPGTCVTSTDPVPYSSCRPSPQLECDPTTYVDTCDGSTLHYCDGEPRAVDCRSLGFSTCDASETVALCN